MQTKSLPIIALLLLCSSAAFADGAQLRLHTLSPFEFVATDTSQRILTDARWARYPVFDGLGKVTVVASVRLPENAVVVAYSISYCTATGVHGLTDVYFRELCVDADGIQCLEKDPYELVDLKPTPGCHSSSTNTERAPVSNAYKRYQAEVTFGMSGDAHLESFSLVYFIAAPPAAATATFSDVPLGHPYHRFIEELRAVGGTAGCGDGKFCPDRAITRGEAAVMIMRSTGISNTSSQSESASPESLDSLVRRKER